MSTTETDRDRELYAQARHEELDELTDREPQAIERDIDATRADMRATLEALERRFSFDRLVDMTVGRVRERGGEFAGNLTDAATRNPMPLLLTSVGLAWMMLASRSGNHQSDRNWQPGRGGRRTMDDLRERAGGISDDLRERAGGISDELRERAGDIRGRAAHAADQISGAVDSTRETLRDAMQSSRETFEETAESLRSRASRAAEITREQTEMARERFDRLLHDQPLVLGALGLAAGAIIGALLPTTEHEDRVLGPMRQKVVKDAAQKSRALYETARDNVASHLAPETDRTGDDLSGERPSSRPH
jgi:ElaB/YqjD/DUF883 family membrane-anchored ribosome-binding protein